MKFSERKGYKSIPQVIQREEMNLQLRNSLWNVFYTDVIKGEAFLEPGIIISHIESKFILDHFVKALYKDFFKVPFDEGKLLFPEIEIKEKFFKATWFEVYDFTEFTCDHFWGNKLFPKEINKVLEREFSAYRLINKIISEVTGDQELVMLETALTDEDSPHVKSHLQRSLELLSDRKNPDYRNSIKESISAVESIAKEISQKPKAELGEALKEIEKQGKLHKAMKSAFLSLYGYTSDADGIRHALMEESNLTADDAKFFLLSCTSFINYLKAKM